MKLLLLWSTRTRPDPGPGSVECQVCRREHMLQHSATLGGTVSVSSLSDVQACRVEQVDSVRVTRQSQIDTPCST